MATAYSAIHSRAALPAAKAISSATRRAPCQSVLPNLPHFFSKEIHLVRNRDLMAVKRIIKKDLTL